MSKPSSNPSSPQEPSTVPQPHVGEQAAAPSKGLGGSQTSQQRAQRTRLFFENLILIHRPSANAAAASASRKPMRQPFLTTPGEREVHRTSKSGRPLSELEILQEKHEGEFKQVVPVIAEALTAVIARHAEIAKTTQQDERYSMYQTNAVPGILVEDYVHRIAEYTYVSPATLVAALVFLDRLSHRHPSLLFTQLNIFKLFFVAVRVGSKVVDLRTLNNKNFASVGGISNRHLNDLEARFLIDIRFDLFLAPREFNLYAQRITSPASQAVPRRMSNTGSAVAAVRRRAAEQADAENGDGH
jgi:hypothetical protein